MDLADELEQAKRHVAEGQAHVNHQRYILEKLGRDGHDQTKARQLLETMEETLRLAREDVSRMQAELEQHPNWPS